MKLGVRALLGPTGLMVAGFLAGLSAPSSAQQPAQGGGATILGQGIRA